MKERMIARVGEMVGDPDLVHQHVIRYAPLIAETCREQGIVVSEYAGLARDAAPWYENRDAKQVTYSSAATGLATDWARLCNDMLERFSASQNRWIAAYG